MDRKAFHDLLKRYLNDKCSAEERALIDQWYELLDDDVSIDANNADINKVEQLLWSKIRNQITVPVGQEEELRQKTTIPIQLKRWMVAATILFGVSVGIYLMSKKTETPGSVSSKSIQAQQGFSEVINQSDTIRLMTFEDGSQILLQPLAKISFPGHFLKSRREVYLEGTAFFNIIRNTYSPFFVYTDKLVTQVLGTSFYIEAKKNSIEVSVRTGKVAVYENTREIKLDDQQKKTNGAIITPNQKVSYYRENRHFVTSLVDTPVPVAAPGNNELLIGFVFDDTPFSEVLSSLEKAYNIELVLENEQLKNCPFTGDLTTQSLFNKLELICQVFEATYEIKGTKILIKGGQPCL